MLIRYMKKRTNLTILLFASFVCLDIGIIFSLISKVIYLQYYQIGLFPSNPYYWILQRISGFRISLACVLFAVLFAYLFKTILFAKTESIKRNYFFITFILASIVFVVLYSTWTFTKPSDDPIGFVLVAVAIIGVYAPFMVESYRLARRVEEEKYRRAIYSLLLMAASFIMIIVCFLVDNIMSDLYGSAYSAFYFLAWIFAVVATAAAYFGYIRPGN
jgi:hypothetical protein